MSMQTPCTVHAQRMHRAMQNACSVHADAMHAASHAHSGALTGASLRALARARAIALRGERETEEEKEHWSCKRPKNSQSVEKQAHEARETDCPGKPR